MMGATLPSPAPVHPPLSISVNVVSDPGVSLSPEDFRRLGVRPDETRTAIIRTAAHRSAKPLAEEHLRTRDPEAETQLVRVATSTYRLLDPRHRETGPARTQVGRILPLALRLAGQTRFVESRPRSSSEEAFRPVDVVDGQIADDFDDWRGFDPPVIDVSGSENGERIGDGAVSSLNSLADRQLQRRRQLLAIGGTVALAASLLWAICTLATSMSGQSELATAAYSEGTDLSDWEASDFLALPLEFAREPAETAEPPILDQAAALQFTPDDLATIDPPRLTSNIAPPMDDDAAEESAFERPTEAEERQSRLSLQMRFPELRRLALPSQVSQQIQILKQAEPSFESGTADDWTCQMLIVELSWLIDSQTKLRPRLQDVAEAYGQSADRLTANSFESACRLASLPETHQHLFQNGMLLADTLLVQESFEASRRIVRALGSTVDALDNREYEAQVNKLSEAIDQAEHLSTLANKTASNAISSESSNHANSGHKWGVTGRYYCLYLRRWDVGLPWLPEAADSRIASAARRELASERATIEATREIASLWLTLASRAQGRVADSMRMHGIELLESLLPKASGLEKLQLRRQIQTESSRLPPYLQRVVVTG